MWRDIFSQIGKYPIDLRRRRRRPSTPPGYLVHNLGFDRRTDGRAVVGQLTAHAYLWMESFFSFFLRSRFQCSAVRCGADPIRVMMYLLLLFFFFLKPKEETTTTTNTHYTDCVCCVYLGASSSRSRLFRPFAHALFYRTYRSSLLSTMCSFFFFTLFTLTTSAFGWLCSPMATIDRIDPIPIERPTNQAGWIYARVR